MQENLTYSEEGIKALLNNPTSAAISEDACKSFQQIDVTAFSEAYAEMPEEEKHELNKEVMQSMMMGFFYPQRFVQYGADTGIFRFFPQIASLDQEEWMGLSAKLPDHDTYTKRQYIATHFKDIDPAFSGIERQVEESLRFNSVMNPYSAFYREFLNMFSDRSPDSIHAFLGLDVLLNLEKVDFEPVGPNFFHEIFERRLLMGPDHVTFTETDFHRLNPGGEHPIIDTLEYHERLIDRELAVGNYLTKGIKKDIATIAAGIGIAFASKELLGMWWDLIGMYTGLAVTTIPSFRGNVKNVLRHLKEMERDNGLFDFQVRQGKKKG